MKKFSKAIKEYKHAQTINGTKPYLVWTGVDYLVTWYFSEKIITKNLGEIILNEKSFKPNNNYCFVD